jgi:hypothetical protein
MAILSFARVSRPSSPSTDEEGFESPLVVAPQIAAAGMAVYTAIASRPGRATSSSEAS